jgi:hypothetical protein
MLPIDQAVIMETLRARRPMRQRPRVRVYKDMITSLNFLCGAWFTKNQTVLVFPLSLLEICKTRVLQESSRMLVEDWEDLTIKVWVPIRLITYLREQGVGLIKTF